jgi:hypothetical protein
MYVPRTPQPNNARHSGVMLPASATAENPPVLRTARSRASRIVRVLVTAVVVAVLGFGITLFTGFPGPGPARRFPIHDLRRLADEINQDGSRWACNREDAPTAAVDLLRSRVVIDWHGHAAASTFAAEDQAMIDDEPHYSTLACAVS